MTGAEHHHLTRVLRLRVGDAVALFDGMGGGHHGEVAAIGRDETHVRLTGPDTRPVDPEFSLTLAQAIPHSEKMEWVIQKATELACGAHRPGRGGAQRGPSPGGAGSASSGGAAWRRRRRGRAGGAAFRSWTSRRRGTRCCRPPRGG